jgi:hypothetical protein
MGGSSTTTVTPAEPSAEELALLQKEVDLATEQLEQLKIYGEFQEKQFAVTGPLLQQQADVAAQQLALQQQQFEASQPLIAQQAEASQQQLALLQQQFGFQAELAPIQQQLLESQLQQQLANAQAGGTPEEQAQAAKQLQDIQLQSAQAQLEAINRAAAGPTEQQLASLEELAQSQIAAGGIDIERFETESLQRLREELAPALGLSASDSPILDRGARVAAEAIRQRGSLAANVRTASMAAAQNLPLAQGQVIGALASSQQQIGLATQQFQSNLAQAATANRLQLGGGFGGQAGAPVSYGGLSAAGGIIGRTAQSGLGLLGSNRATPGSVGLGLGQQRIAAATRTTSTSPGFFDMASALGTAGIGIAAVAGMSDARLKDNIITTDDQWDAIHSLAGLVKDFDMFGVHQTGFVAQDLQEPFPELVGEMDADTLGVQYRSIFSKAVQVIGTLQRRVENLESDVVGIEALVAP